MNDIIKKTNNDKNTCPNCGKVHKTSVKEVVSEPGAVEKISEFIKLFNSSKPFILADSNTYKAAGERVSRILNNDGISYSEYLFGSGTVKPDEKSVGSVMMHYDSDCDLIIAVGSGVINDTGKILSKLTKNPYIIVATAPSMDGYASATSSMDVDGLKVSLSSRCPDVIIGDTDILKNAPIRMIQSGLGDMLAKYISICEWRIAHLLIGEYYCEYVADLVRAALKKCIDNAGGVLKREPKAVKAVFDGLIMAGKAMEYAGISRPASGVEHYISHIWDMRGLAFGTKTDLHGIQCAIGTLVAARVYEKLKKYSPDKEKALAYVKSFDVEKWNESLTEFVGGGAAAMIELEKKEQKYSVEKHRARLDKIINNWDEIVKIINEEVPSAEEIERILYSISAPKTCDEIGIDNKILPMTFKASKDIRDKYVLSRLCWDLGITEDAVKWL